MEKAWRDGGAMLCACAWLRAAYTPLHGMAVCTFVAHGVGA